MNTMNTQGVDDEHCMNMMNTMNTQDETM